MSSDGIAGHLRSNVVGYAALLIALAAAVGGVAYAAIPSATGEITGCHANGSGSLRVIDAEAGQACRANETQLAWNQGGEQGPKTRFAYIRDFGSGPATVQYGSGVTAVNDPEGGEEGGSYVVTFDRSLVNCVVQAVAGFGDPQGTFTGAVPSSPTIVMGTGPADQVKVFFVTDTGASTDTAFMITAFC